ncbi:MAG: hypothetical protein ACPGUV_12205, partial [Polyangiales bacterium]
AASGIELMLVDDDHQLLASDHTGTDASLLYHCPTRSGRFQVVGRAGRGAHRFVVLLGREQAMPTGSVAHR